MKYIELGFFYLWNSTTGYGWINYMGHTGYVIAIWKV
jgi:hypothetical protein